MEYLSTKLFDLKPSRVALGTWAIGGALWGGTNEADSVSTILTALDQGINVIDTAPAYGQGQAEKYVAKALESYKQRDRVIISTKAGLQFLPDGSVVRNSTAEFLHEDCENSLKRLGTDYIDIYYIHWPDPLEPIENTAKVMDKLYRDGKIRAIGLSNFSVKQCQLFRQIAPIHFVQPPYNIFERDIEKEIIGYCKKEKIMLMTYSVLCRGLLSGKMSKKRKFEGDDLRKGLDAEFQPPVYDEHLAAAERLKELAQRRYGRTLLELAVRWALDQGSQIAIWGARRPSQLEPLDGIFNWHINNEGKKEIDEILKATIKHPADVSWMGPPARKAAA